MGVSLVVDEGVFVDGLDDGPEGDLGGQGVAVLDHRVSVGTIPAVHCTQDTHTVFSVTCPILD